MKCRVHKTILELCQGDITQQRVDAVVNAANARLAGGGGVDGAVHRAGGGSIMEECRRIGGCPTGCAVVTTAGNLPARAVIHTVGPVYRNGSAGEPQLLVQAYTNSLKRAEENAFASIAFPSLSTGAYGYPIDEAAGIALSAVCRYLEGTTVLEKVVFVLFNERDLSVYTQQLVYLKGKGGYNAV